MWKTKTKVFPKIKFLKINSRRVFKWSLLLICYKSNEFSVFQPFASHYLSTCLYIEDKSDVVLVRVFKDNFITISISRLILCCSMTIKQIISTFEKKTKFVRQTGPTFAFANHMSITIQSLLLNLTTLQKRF